MSLEQEQLRNYSKIDTSFKIVLGLLAAATVAGMIGLATGAAKSGADKAVPRATAVAPADLQAKLLKAIPELGNIDSIKPAPVAGLFEVVANGSDIIYADASGQHIVSGAIIEVASKTNLTDQRMNALLAVDFDKLPVEDAFTVVRGDGSRKMAIFADPNCGYCKLYEKTLQSVDNATIHMFLIPILGPDSVVKSEAIWCSEDTAGTYLSWMINGVVPKSGQACDTGALERNVAFAQKHRITGTPTTIFPDGSRTAGSIPLAAVQERLGAGS